MRYQLQIFWASSLYPKTLEYQFWSTQSIIQWPNFKMTFGPFSLTWNFYKIVVLWNITYFTFSAISHDSRYLQSHTIWQNKHLNLTNLISFIIYVNKNIEKGVKMVIYDGQICLTTLYLYCNGKICKMWTIYRMRTIQKCSLILTDP